MSDVFTKFAVRISALVFATLLFSATASAQALLGQEPPASKIVTTGNGLEWVYAAPCAGEQPSCGTVMLHHDFRFATESEWLSSFGDLAGLIAAFSLGSFNQAMCAAPEFSTVHNHCDSGDAVNGYVWHAPVGIAASLSHAANGAAETFLVRGAVSVPAPATILLLGLGLLGVSLRRRFN